MPHNAVPHDRSRLPDPQHCNACSSRRLSMFGRSLRQSTFILCYATLPKQPSRLHSTLVLGDRFFPEPPLLWSACSRMPARLQQAKQLLHLSWARLHPLVRDVCVCGCSLELYCLLISPDLTPLC